MVVSVSGRQGLTSAFSDVDVYRVAGVVIEALLILSIITVVVYLAGVKVRL